MGAIGRRFGVLMVALAMAGLGMVALATGSLPARAQLNNDIRHDTSQPIEITADSLEVEQERQVAIFTGNVDVVQGELNLRADRLVVYYREADGNNRIKRIEAEGNVFLSSPDEMAQGERGVYDVDAETVELDGNVVLTQGKNVVRGDRMVLNLATGKSKMESAAADKKGRVKALFVPNKASKKAPAEGGGQD